ncbi:hypothetical protein [Haladaptatus sp. GCM10025893]|uniref:hypothetical protein n=1 Tax=Haladaptatus sp. GCM10025893 TaxID=3252659 RepID=UPI00360B8852
MSRGRLGWEFASLTYGAIGELAIALLHELELVSQWETLDGLVPRREFEPLQTAGVSLTER